MFGQAPMTTRTEKPAANLRQVDGAREGGEG
jgi:hypothetical protein